LSQSTGSLRAGYAICLNSSDTSAAAENTLVLPRRQVTFSLVPHFGVIPASIQTGLPLAKSQAAC
jgi:hypothetical protein